MKNNRSSSSGRFLTVLFVSLVLGSSLFTPDDLLATSAILRQQGKITNVRVDGLSLIEPGIVYSAIGSQIGAPLSPKKVAEDIKSLYRLGYFKDVEAEIERGDEDSLTLIFKLVEKPTIDSIEIVGNHLLNRDQLKKKLKVFRHNMVNLKRIEADVRTIRQRYKEKGNIQTLVTYELKPLTDSTLALTYKIVEAPRVFLTKINITGTRVFSPLDIERLMGSAEIDCFAWGNQSGVFDERKVNQDLQIITQHYLSRGYIKIKIDKPQVELIRNKDYSRVIVNLHITEGDKYFTGKIDIVSSDGHTLLFDKEEMINQLELGRGAVFNPFKQNGDRFRINKTYLERGYAFARVKTKNTIHEDSKVVDVTYMITRGEKAYIGRVEIQGNYETLDYVVRRELEIHDDELYNGAKLMESKENVTRLGYFKPGIGVRFQPNADDAENTLDYNIVLEEGQTGTFNASLAYSGQAGAAVTLSVSKKNFLGTGRTVKISAERKDKGDTRYDFSMTNPYWLDSEFTNTFGIYSTLKNATNYDIRTNGFYYGLSYPVWKYWQAFSTYTWKNENYSSITEEGALLLEGVESNTFRSLRLGAEYNTVDHPLFPSRGVEVSFVTEQYGGPLLGGTTEYRSNSFNTKYFKTLNEDGTVVFGVKFNWSHLIQTNADKSIPSHKRYRVGGVTSVRGFEWNEIRGPSSVRELPDGFDIKKLYPYRGDCDASMDCSSLSATKHPDRVYYEGHWGGISKRVLNVQLYFPLTREGKNIRGLVFFDAGNVWAEDRMYDIIGVDKDPFYMRRSVGTGINIITPMGVIRFEYGVKMDKKEGESPSQFHFHISGLF